MGRHHAKGLDQFPFDSDTRTKLDRFCALFPGRGRAFFYVCLEEIFKEGWNLSISSKSTVALLAARAGCPIEDWNMMLAMAIKEDLFAAGFYEEQLILTSEGIKARWEVVSRKRLKSAEDYKGKKKTGTETPETVFSAPDMFQICDRNPPPPPSPLPPAPLSPSFPPTPPYPTPYTPPSNPLSLPPPPAPGKPGRKPNEVWDWVCEAFGLEPKTRNERTRIGRVASDLKAKGATREGLRMRMDRYRQEWPKAACTPEAIAKHWDHFGQERATGMNGTSTNRETLDRNMADALAEMGEG